GDVVVLLLDRLVPGDLDLLLDGLQLGNPHPAADGLERGAAVAVAALLAATMAAAAAVAGDLVRLGFPAAAIIGHPAKLFLHDRTAHQARSDLLLLDRYGDVVLA